MNKNAKHNKANTRLYRIYYDMKLREIAEYYETTTSIIYTKYQNALKKLKDYYKKGDFHE